MLRPVAPGVLIATSRRDATNSVVVIGVGRRALLVDPAWTPDELDGFARNLAAMRIQVAAGFSTHAHFDHLLWHPGFGAAPRFASERTVERARMTRSSALAELGPGVPRAVADAVGAIRPGTPTVDGVTAQPITHDAHSPGHTALLLPGRRVLIAGDMLSDREIPLLDETASALDDYATALDLLAGPAASAALVIPGHGRPGTDGAERVAADRRYLEALRSGREPADRRLANHGMRAAHDANRRIIGG